MVAADPSSEGGFALCVRLSLLFSHDSENLEFDGLLSCGGPLMAYSSAWGMGHGDS